MSVPLKLSAIKLENALQTCQNEIVVADLYDDPLSLNDFEAEIARVGRNYGKDYLGEQSAKCADLLEAIIEKGWTNERFKLTAKYLIQQNRFATWTQADWFEAPMRKLITYSGYKALVHEKGASVNSELQKYILNGVTFWAWKKDGELPFPKPPKEIAIPKPTEEPVIAPEPIDFTSLRSKLVSEPPRENRVKRLEDLIKIEGE